MRPIKYCKAQIVHSTIPGMVSIRGPLGKGNNDPIRQRLEEAGFIPGEKVVVVLEKDFEEMRDQLRLFLES